MFLVFLLFQLAFSQMNSDSELRFIGTFGFLDSLALPDDEKNALHKLPDTLFHTKMIIPTYLPVINRCCIDGELSNRNNTKSEIDLLLSSLPGPSERSEVRVISILILLIKVLEVIQTLTSELARRVKDKFSLRDLRLADREKCKDLCNELGICNSILAQSNPTRLKEMGVGFRVIHGSSSNLAWLDSETQEVLRKRLRTTTDNTNYVIKASVTFMQTPHGNVGGSIIQLIILQFRHVIVKSYCHYYLSYYSMRRNVS